MIKQRPRTFFIDQSVIVEKTLNSFGIDTKVAAINKEKSYVEYCISITVGTSIDEIKKHELDLALALASSTGKIKIVAPIPGKALIGIRVPYPTKEMIRKIYEREKEENITLRRMVSNIFMYIGALFFMISDKIEKK